MFTDSLSRVLLYLQFWSIIIYRAVVIVFKRNKKVVENYLDYRTENVFDTSFYTLHYSFDNALYYKLNNNKTTDGNLRILNINQSNPLVVDFTVYGLFSKLHYSITINPDKTLNTQSFKTQLFNLNIKLFPVNPRIIEQHIHLKKQNVSLVKHTIQVSQNKLNIRTNSFNQNDFL
jgi:hypothetical protein